MPAVQTLRVRASQAMVSAPVQPASVSSPASRWSRCARSGLACRRRCRRDRTGSSCARVRRAMPIRSKRMSRSRCAASSRCPTASIDWPRPSGECSEPGSCRIAMMFRSADRTIVAARRRRPTPTRSTLPPSHPGQPKPAAPTHPPFRQRPEAERNQLGACARASRRMPRRRRRRS